MNVAIQSDIANLTAHEPDRAVPMRALMRELQMQLEQSETLARTGENGELDREAREILAALLDVAPGEISRRSSEPVGVVLADRARSVANRRGRGEPLAYCLGTAAFRHLVLRVDSRVLIPRPETEVVVDEALRATRDQSGGVAVDIGTGSGAIALSLATEGRFERVVATDVSTEALAVAKLNALRLVPPHAALEFRLGADLAPLEGIKACLIVSNPPYIAPDEGSALPASVRDWEPALALFAEDGGMARYDALLAGAPDYLEVGGWLVLEVDARRAQETARRATATQRYTGIRLIRDLAGRERVLVAQTIDTLPNHDISSR